MKPPALTTDRLQLVAANVDLSRANLHDRAGLARLLGARVPPAWPPPLNDEASMAWMLRFCEENPDAAGWGMWYYIARDGDDAGRVVVGNGGFTGKPADDGTVEIGYSILEEFQGRGYATEATKRLIAWAFEHPEVRRVIAESYPELVPSIRVMEKCGFVFIGPGSEERVVRYQLTRATI